MRSSSDARLHLSHERSHAPRPCRRGDRMRTDKRPSQRTFHHLDALPGSHEPHQRGKSPRHASARRREFLRLLGGALLALPSVARAQQPKPPIRIGMLPCGSASREYDRSLVEVFRDGLRQVGLIEDRDSVLDVVWTDGDHDASVAQLLQRGAKLLVPCGSSASVAAKRQSSVVPIIFIAVGNPVAMGLVENLPHPGQNATGFLIFSPISAASW
jgi:hypothetical protein